MFNLIKQIKKKNIKCLKKHLINMFICIPSSHYNPRIDNMDNNTAEILKSQPD